MHLGQSSSTAPGYQPWRPGWKTWDALGDTGALFDQDLQEGPFAAGTQSSAPWPPKLRWGAATFGRLVRELVPFAPGASSASGELWKGGLQAEVLVLAQAQQAAKTLSATG